MLRPIFFEGDLVGYSSQWGNLIDVGGTAAGSMPISARSIYHEGVRMPPIKLYDQGKLNEEALRLFCHNTRAPKEVEADIKAIAAGTAAGAARVIELCERFGKDTYLEACDAILDRTRSARHRADPAATCPTASASSSRTSPTTTGWAPGRSS